VVIYTMCLNQFYMEHLHRRYLRCNAAVIGYCAVSNEVDAGAWILSFVVPMAACTLLVVAIRRKESTSSGISLLQSSKVLLERNGRCPYILCSFRIHINVHLDYVGIYFLILSIGIALFGLSMHYPAWELKMMRVGKSGLIISINY